MCDDRLTVRFRLMTSRLLAAWDTAMHLRPHSFLCWHSHSLRAGEQESAAAGRARLRLSLMSLDSASVLVSLRVGVSDNLSCEKQTFYHHLQTNRFEKERTPNDKRGESPFGDPFHVLLHLATRLTSCA